MFSYPDSADTCLIKPLFFLGETFRHRRLRRGQVRRGDPMRLLPRRRNRP
jgi:hypothetical protein